MSRWGGLNSQGVASFPCQTGCTIMVIIFWHFLIFDQMFLSPQVKQRVITSNKHGINELPHELPNDLRLRILGNLKNQENIKTS